MVYYVIISVQSIFEIIDKTLRQVLNMWTDKALSKLSDKTTYRRDDLFHLFLNEKPDLSGSTFRWILYSLLQERKIFRVDYDTYTTERAQVLPIYKPYYSDKAAALMNMLTEQFPQLSFVIFESVLLNEFLNHQIAQNTIYVQVEKEVSSYIFDILREKYAGTVLYKPGKKEFERYWTRDCVVVWDLISQAPLSQEKPHEITVEKMLVDLIADKSIAATFSPAEIPFIYENVMKSYQVDIRKMNRYAGRRGKASTVKEYMGDAD